MSDFGAEEAFARAAVKLKEHYGIVVPVSAVREITEAQGATMLAQEKQKGDGPDRPGVPRWSTAGSPKDASGEWEGGATGYGL